MSENTKNNLRYIKSGISKNLDYKRAQLDTLDNLLEEVNQSIEEKLEFKPERVFKHFSTYKTMLIPQFGYHIEVKLKNAFEFENDVINAPDYPQIIQELKKNGWTFCFQKKENSKVYFRTFQTDVLNSEMGDIISEISVIESEILFEIQNLLIDKYKQQLVDMSDSIYHLDAFFSLAIAAIKLGLKCPIVKHDTKPYVSFKNGGFEITNNFNDEPN